MGLGIEPLCPAYGRDYKSVAEVLEDFNKNLDFCAGGPEGPKINKQDLLDVGATQVRVRFNKLRKTTIIKVEK